jgi:para-nitrobenzyl esterase
MNRLRWIALASMMLLTACQSTSAPQPVLASAAPAPLQGSSWRLVQLDFSDGTQRAAIERSRYTIGFGTGGVLNVRFDCNRGRGSWTSAGPGQLQFGELALTRALCPTGSLYDDLVRQWPQVRSYQIRDGRLFLILMADGGSIEFEPSP